MKASTILIVDDDKTVIKQLVTYFRRSNYEPIATADSRIVKQTLENFEVHLILLDLRMERLSGYEVLKDLRDRNISIPVLIITAYYEDEKEKLAQIGITREDVIKKPFADFAIVEAIIKKKLNKTEPLGEAYSDFEDKIYLRNETNLWIIEDEEQITDMLKEAFEERHYDVQVFHDGRQVSEELKKGESCHVAIVDIAIPKIPGHQLIKQMMETDPKIRIIPISGLYAEEVKEKLAEIGFDSNKLVQKPVDIPTIIEKVKELAVETGALKPH